LKELAKQNAILIAGAEEGGEATGHFDRRQKCVGRKSQCEPLAEVIMAEVEVG
jgi:hypothetical protein